MKDEFLEYLNSSSGISPAMLEAARQAYGITRCLDEALAQSERYARMQRSRQTYEQASSKENIQAIADALGRHIEFSDHTHWNGTEFMYKNVIINVHGRSYPNLSLSIARVNNNIKSSYLVNKIRMTSEFVFLGTRDFGFRKLTDKLKAIFDIIDSVDSVSNIDDTDVLTKTISEFDGGDCHAIHFYFDNRLGDVNMNELMRHVYDDSNGVNRRAIEDLVRFLGMDPTGDNISEKTIQSFAESKLPPEIYDKYINHLLDTYDAVDILFFLHASVGHLPHPLGNDVAQKIINKVEIDPLSYTDWANYDIIEYPNLELVQYIGKYALSLVS